MADVGHEVDIGNLPFKPVRGQVIYVDSDSDKRINAFIVSNYDWLRKLFRDNSLDFCYLPLLGEELISYHAPYLGDEQRQDLLQSVPSITSLIEVKSPSLLYGLDDAGDGGLCLLPINARWYSKLDKVFTALAENIKRDLASHYPTRHHENVVSEPTIRYSLSEDRHDIKLSEDVWEEEDVLFRDDDDDYTFDAESEMLISEIRERIEALRNKGVNTMFLHGIVDEGERVSSLYITRDYRIILPEYQNMEITMPALPRAVYILFLKHPEGIRFKDLPEYYDELLGIYRILNPIGGTQRQKQSIMNVTNPLSNSINEKCARIKEAFVQHFDDRLAQNYYITGKKGEPKRIALSPCMIVWEQ